MKLPKILLAALSAVLAAVLVYCFGAFIAVSFDISTWTSDGRALTAYVGFCAAILSAGLVVTH